MNKLIDFPYTNILVLGLARSGTAATKLLLKNEKNVRVNDMNTSEADENVIRLRELGADVIVGDHPLSVLEGIEIIVKNPGIPYDNIVIREAEKRNIPIITEVELASKLVGDNIIGITGSNGKTTTTTLIDQMLLQSNLQSKIAGNIGTVATEVAQGMSEEEKMVLELSSFQLLGIQTFKPKIAILLNVYEAHLDYHKTMENYRKAKFNIFKNQTEDDYLVYNKDDSTINQVIKNARAQLVPFSIKEKELTGAWANDESLFFKREKIIDKREIVLVGNHNLENILAAISAAKISGATNEAIRKVLTTFSGVEHRLEFVAKVNNRLFYNDSKATNILATQKALSSFQQPTILLAGGLDRGNDFDELEPYLKHVKAMVLFGQTAKKLQEMALKANIDTYVLVNNISEAVEQAYALSDSGDVVLLSPACASWDQYRTFEERGDMFSRTVHKLL